MRSSPRHPLLDRVFPMPAVELLDRQRGEVDAIKTADVDVDLVRIGTRHIERMDAAMLAEGVLRGPGAELIGRKLGLAAHALELLRRHDQMQEALHAAERAVAIGHAIEARGGAKRHPPAVATAFVGLPHPTSPTVLREQPEL